MIHDECRYLFDSSKSLLVKSGLTCFLRDSFVAKDSDQDFENYWSENFDPEYGRYMAWVWFSVGAENLVKSALVCCIGLKGKPVRLGYPVFSPETNSSTWIREVLNPQFTKGSLVTNEAKKFEYLTLGTIWNSKLDTLAQKCKVQKVKQDELKAAYKYLTQTIRNRDAHTYVKDQRIKDFPAVKGIFVPAFNTLVQTMKGNGHFKEHSNS